MWRQINIYLAVATKIPTQHAVLHILNGQDVSTNRVLGPERGSDRLIHQPAKCLEQLEPTV